jgi:MoxR-like ATPase
VIDYIAALIRGTRDVADLESGASPRAGAMLAGAARARAAIDGRDFVIPDDVKALAPALLRHRLILSPAAEIDGRVIEDVVAGIIDAIEAPR